MAPGYPASLWYLGSQILANGNHYAQTVLAPGPANGAPESPVYVLSSGASKLSMSCTQCTNPTVTAIGASDYCEAQDVVVRTSYNGFLSDPLYLFIDRPWNLIASNPWIVPYSAYNGDTIHDVWNVPQFAGDD